MGRGTPVTAPPDRAPQSRARMYYSRPRSEERMWTARIFRGRIVTSLQFWSGLAARASRAAYPTSSSRFAKRKACFAHRSSDRRARDSRRSQHAAQSDHGGARSVFHCLRSAPARIALWSPPTSFSLADGRACLLARPQHGGARSEATSLSSLLGHRALRIRRRRHSRRKNTSARFSSVRRRAICRRFIAR
jgi:hypothetical protein